MELERLIDPDMLCSKQSYCTDPPNYPDKQLAGALAKNPLLLGMFDNAVVEEVMQLRSGEVLGDGDGEDDEAFEEVNACDSRTSYILPRAARSVKGSFMFIVNQPAQEKLSQVVRVTTCREPGHSCYGGQLEGRGGLRTVCRQQYTDHKLVALDQDKDEVVVETFTFPSCCSCFVAKDLPWQ